MTLDIPWLLFGSTFRLDAVAAPLLAVASVLYAVAAVAIAFRRPALDRRGQLLAFLGASYLGNVGVYLAADIVTFYLAFALMSFSAVGLVTHARTRQSHRATGVYLVMTVLSETALLAGLWLTGAAGGRLIADAPAAIAASSHPGVIMALLIIGFGVKAGLVPLHVWLPLAHPAAPPAASAVLSGVMVKAGVIGWLLFLPPGLDALAWVLLVLSLAGAFAAPVIGILQTDPKVILAYSTISQLGFLGAVIAAGMLIDAPVTAAVVIYAVHHGLAKGALFLGVPVWQAAAGARRRVATAGLAWAGLALVGFPLTSGALAKYDAKDAVADHWVYLVLPLVATGSSLLLVRFAWALRRMEDTPRRVDGEFLGWLVLCVAGVCLPFIYAHPALEPGTLWDMLWPLLIAVPLGWWWWRRGPAEAPVPVPAGDVVVIGERVLDSLRSTTVLERVHGVTGDAAKQWARGWATTGEATENAVEGIESRVRVWSLSGLVTVILLSALLALGWWI
ncbi:proton-conducting transporter membrane subunit [Corynebacterium sp.]|uniref:proton-conducting transporter transmembrane domain-containing protein n=1 Tax=Corynebacterium sp. TaxID=1720 RepID=UPI0026E018D8|nr:proton-conducting transporter membrane subunit [Corynebacterium sp.]MDO5512306.1 proton-conducting transporter membrane subunit [Corynebacterium sp.]